MEGFYLNYYKYYYFITVNPDFPFYLNIFEFFLINKSLTRIYIYFDSEHQLGYLYDYN